MAGRTRLLGAIFCIHRGPKNGGLKLCCSQDLPFAQRSFSVGRNANRGIPSTAYTRKWRLNTVALQSVAPTFSSRWITTTSSNDGIIQELLDRAHTWGSKELEEEEVLDVLYRLEETKWSNVDLDLALRFLERLGREEFLPSDQFNRNVISFLKSWKVQIKGGGKVTLRLEDIMQSLERMERFHCFQWKVRMVKPILKVVIYQAGSHNAPEEATRFLHRMRERHPDLPFGPFTYDHILVAWAVSGRPEAVSQMIWWLDEELPRLGVKEHIVTWSPLLRYYGEEGDIEQMEAVLDLMKIAGLENAMMEDPCTHRNLLVGYAKGGRHSLARQLFHRLKRLPPSPRRNLMLQESNDIWKAHGKR